MQLEKNSAATRLAIEKKLSCDSICNQKNSQLQPDLQLKKFQLRLYVTRKKSQLEKPVTTPFATTKKSVISSLTTQKLPLQCTTSRATKKIPTKAAKTSQQHKYNKSSLTKQKLYSGHAQNETNKIQRKKCKK